MKALEKWYGKAPVFEPLPKFAEEKRDLALVMNKDITCGQVEECIYQACSFVKDVTLFDVYEGQQIAEDKKSMAFTVLFTPKEEAFQADTVDGYVKKILKQLKKAYEIENLEQFIQRVRKYENLDELTPYALRELVKAIYIEAPDKSSGKRHQGIRISYDLVGFIPVEELLKQETA